MDEQIPVVIVGGTPPSQAILRRGRPKGSGKNIRLLNKVIPGRVDSYIDNLNKKTMNSIRTSAHQQGIPVKVREWTDGTYRIWRL